MNKLEKYLPEDSIYKYVLAVLLGLYILNIAGRYIYWNYRNSQLEARAKAFADEKHNRKHEFIKVENESKFLDLDVTQLREKLLYGEITSEQLVHIFANRCYTIGRRLGLSAEECFDEAIEEAKIKDKLQQKGKRTTIGTQFMMDNLSEEDGAIVKVLKQQGAIILVRDSGVELQILMTKKDLVVDPLVVMLLQLLQDVYHFLLQLILEVVSEYQVISTEFSA
ncbi:UNKNOWN [Stylonychia lemnae]|uniref:Amidase domain-containing protein n=1 Tax=Stylonychia lemnae TaxID=5949 RepID=A0A078AY08_STYLE|nr:UNKNOWN [Stylonychia lemnae]|eukprot:CDW86102.1 UNKNOWN [Stylonychia lemnae]